MAGQRWPLDDDKAVQIIYKVDTAIHRMISRCSNMSKVWEVLDAEYAQEQEVINAVDIELYQLISSECSTPEYIIIMLRIYPPTLKEALKAVHGLDHLQSPDRVNLLTRKFD